MANEAKVKEEISLKELIEIGKEWFVYLLSQWKIIIIAGVFGAVLGLTYSLVIKPVYTASLSFALESEKSGGIGGVLGLASSFGFDLGGGGGGIFEGSNLIELFKSRKMVEQTLLTPVIINNKTISLAEMYIQINEWRDNKPKLSKIQFSPDTKRKYFTRVHDSILGLIYEDLLRTSLYIGQKDKKIDIISLEVTSKNELFAKYFCEGLAIQVGRFYVATKTKKAKANMAILQRQTDSIRGELNNSITGVAVANDNTFALNPALNVRRVPSAKRQVDVQANSAILTELVKQSELAKVSLRRETPLIQVIDKPILPLKKEKVGKANGIFLGGILGGILVILYLIFTKKIKELD
ncbi:Wzz/FepE/Etk N-terminal domain-containing protein [Flavobacterium soyangense]|uniref:Lipopolysaccharide biosynthesis protein n=1 Tax=Flavobacterium soyangense TaxID=2023265 RepID=A0A930UB52_9FLAO|nr:Wzz/FepE/Etk N-terminal domain-containing protein [Flavobacterium soyangense]MBF2708204.1 lipopolysaccharide biosynthesis protein [Flavobacterium soyangense]